MHDDERRRRGQARRLLTQDVPRDPEGVVEQLETQRTALHELRSRVRTAEATAKTAGARAGGLARELKEAREEIERLRAAERERTAAEPTVPGAESEVAAGPAAAGPAAAGTAAASAGAEARAEDPAEARGVAAEAKAAEQPDPQSAGDAAGADPKASELSLERLEDELEQEPTPGRLAACLNRLWYAHGAMDRAAELIAGHAGLIPEMAPKQRELVERIRGTAHLETILDRIVPARSAGAAYLPERDRIMYCAYSTPAFHSNGYSVRTRGVVSGLRQAGADVFVAARSGYPWDLKRVESKPARRRRHSTRIDGVEYVHRPEGDATAMRVDDYVQVAADSYVREARLRRPSLIHAASNFLSALPALIAARRLGLPFVYEVRGLWEVTEASAKEGWADSERYAWQARMEAFVAAEADAVLAITQETKDELVRRGVPADRIRLLPNGADTASFLPIPRDDGYAKTHGITADAPVIGFAGSFVAYEGLELLLQAANILRGRKVPFQIALAGSGGVYPELKALKERYRLGSRVRFVGRLPAEEIPRFLSAVDIVACPRLSLPVTEMVSPLKPLEAYAASKPTVLSDVSPHRVLAGEDLERGLLFEPGNPKSLANALQALVEDPELRTAKGRAGRLWAVDERQWPLLGRRLLQVHREAAEAHRTAAAEGRPVSQLRIGLIADEFTTKTLQRAARIVVLERDGFEVQLREADLDLVFIESAWNGNDGQWHRGVGWYSEEEDEPMARLLEQCRGLGIPTVFWNKEDPVHIDRFRRTGARADHAFTTDADMIGAYLREAHELAGAGAATASSSSFYADPAVHNPLPSARPYEDSIAYAGTFYGERYAQRSQQLEQLLRAARTAADGDLVIYDRQLAVPDSPYRFPPEFAGAVRGALPYDEVLDSYKSHIANLNVNSVSESPTMFSRRVVEIAASGGLVMSAWSRGLTETFDGLIPNTSNELYWKAYLRAWAHDPEEHLGEAWLQMRTVLRSHTVETALILMARTAGIAVRGLRLPSWGCDLRAEDADRVIGQSVPPQAVRAAGATQEQLDRARDLGIAVLDAADPLPSDLEWWAELPFVFARTWAEDLLWSTRWGGWDILASRYRDAAPGDGRIPARPGPIPEDANGRLSRLDAAGSAEAPEALVLTLPRPAEDRERARSAAAARTSSQEPADPAAAGRILVAGHDLKFARSWIEHLTAGGAEVLLDEWENHAEHDEQRSLELLSRADTVFCEWGLGNAVWYSQHVRPDQRLVVRVHAQELRRPYLRRIRHAAVDQYVFVGELMRDAAVRSHGVPRGRTRVVPNIVRADELRRPKTEAAETTVGLVGIVPQVKRLDRAVTVIEDLASRDPRWTLRVKGRRPEDYAWMLRREDEMAWYDECYRRIEELNRRVGREAVVFDPHGDDMPEWFRGVGYALSVSDLESFHLTLPDGAASGAVPVSLAWPGADRIYPREWLTADLGGLADRIRELQDDDQARDALVGRAAEFVLGRMDEAVVHAELDRVLVGEKESAQ